LTGTGCPPLYAALYGRRVKTHVASLYFKCFICFIDMLQVFHVDIAKVDRDVAYVASVSEAYYKCLFKMFHLFFRRMFASVFNLDVAYISHMLQEYIPIISTVMLQ
jgi:hypothetical protein